MKNTELRACHDTPLQQIENKIITIRNQNVILDRDVATLYGVQTKEVSQAIKRNPKKFPDGYVFRLNVNEINKIKALTANSQPTDNQELVTICDLPLNTKHIAEINAFTEKGLYMLATILKSERAIEATLEIIEVFAKMRELSRNIAMMAETEVVEPEVVEKTGSMLNDLLFSHFPTTSAETSVEFNVGILKGKRTIKSENVLQDKIDRMEKMMEQLIKNQNSTR
jgi:phage regulator Rha-like protein